MGIIAPCSVAKCRGSWIVVVGVGVGKCRGSWVVGRGSWVGKGIHIFTKFLKNFTSTSKKNVFQNSLTVKNVFR